MQSTPQAVAPPAAKRVVPQPPPEYGERIRELREAAGLTQEQVASAVGDLRASIANQERAQRAPYEDDGRVRLLARVLRTDEEELAAVAKHCRPNYVLTGAAVSQAHREVASFLDQHWGQLSDAALAAATRIAEAAPVHQGPPVEQPSAFGAWLSAQRFAANPQLSQSDVGEQLGVTRSYVAMVEGGAKGVSWPHEAVSKVAALFGAQLADVEALVARSQQAYALPGREASRPHRALAAVLAQRWRELPESALVEVLATLAPRGRKRRT